MLGVAMKDMGRYALSAAIYIALTAWFWLSRGHGLAAATATLNGIGLFLAVFAPMVLIEANEERCKGYEILASLPLGVREIVAAKHLLPALAVALLTVYNLALFTVMEDPRGVIATCRAILFIDASLCLLAVGIMYLVVYRFGVMTFIMAVTALGVAANFFFLWLGASAYRNPRIAGAIMERTVEMPWYAAAGGTAAVLALFILLARISVGIKIRRLAG